MISLSSRDLVVLAGRHDFRRMLARRGVDLSGLERIEFDAGFDRALMVVPKGADPIGSEFWADEKNLHVAMQRLWVTL